MYCGYYRNMLTPSCELRSCGNMEYRSPYSFHITVTIVKGTDGLRGCVFVAFVRGAPVCLWLTVCNGQHGVFVGSFDLFSAHVLFLHSRFNLLFFGRRGKKGLGLRGVESKTETYLWTQGVGCLYSGTRLCAESNRAT